MGLKLYNTLTRKKEKFVPIKKGHVGIYTCGPTVYWSQHVGNLRSYIFADVLKRVLMYNGFDVKHVINVTDVGHLTSDADSGDDKIEKAAAKERKTAKEISHFYFDVFKRDFEKLNLIEPFKWAWATEHIKEQIGMIKILEKKNYTYKTNDGIYFDTSKFKDYGKLSNKKIEGLEAGKRIALGEKKSKTDFALWKFSGEPGKRQQEWNSPWGLGFPGWHIECSAMASKYLGKQFDIHTGGEDNMPIHHENEIAQSECAWGIKSWVNYWIHGAFLNFKGGKMSKSSGKIKTISELEKDGVEPLAYRYFTFSAHYRKPLTWSGDGVNDFQKEYIKVKKRIQEIAKDEGITDRLVKALLNNDQEYKKEKASFESKINKGYIKKFEERINDDLDMPGAVAVLHNLLKDTTAKNRIATIEKMDQVFGLELVVPTIKRMQSTDKQIKFFFSKIDLMVLRKLLAKEDNKRVAKIIEEVIEEKEKKEFPVKIITLRDTMDKARKNKDYGTSDNLRNKIEKEGYKVESVPGVPVSGLSPF